MDDENQIFTVAGIGIGDDDKRVLSQALTISQSRVPSFRPYGPSNGTATPHIVVVNGESSQAMRAWQSYHAAHGHKGIISPIMIVTTKPTGASHAYALRPITPGGLLSLLENVLIKDHGFKSEPMIHARHDRHPKAMEDSASADQTRRIAALVVDSSLPARVQLKMGLADLVDHADFAEDGDQALKLVSDNQYNIIFLGIELPGEMDGYQLCKSLKTDPRIRNTPVVMLASHSAPADQSKGTQVGCDTYLIKPIKQVILQEVVQEFLKSRTVA